jgi:hypothetical protein
MQPVIFETLPLPPGIRSRFVPNINGLTMHLLEAGFESQDRPCVLLLHGFPELAYSWRKVMLPLAALTRPRKHSQGYYSTHEADANMRHCLQGIHPGAPGAPGIPDAGDAGR